jgi:hypothetical protein
MSPSHRYSGLRIPLDQLSEGQLYRLADAAPLIKANFNPDEPRIPAGQLGAGEWTTGSEAGETAATGGRPPIIGPGEAQTLFTYIDWKGEYQDKVVKAFTDYLKSEGGNAITLVPFDAINGMTAIADIVASLPGTTAFVLEVKIGENASFTPAQRIVYPMLQVGGHVSSADPRLASVGLTPAVRLPPLDVYVYWVRVPGQRGEVYKLPPPEFVPE